MTWGHHWWWWVAFFGLPSQMLRSLWAHIDFQAPFPMHNTQMRFQIRTAQFMKGFQPAGAQCRGQRGQKKKISKNIQKG